MIIFISSASLLCTIQLVLQHCDCRNVGLQYGGAVHNTKLELESRRAPAVYQRMMPHRLPRKRELQTNFRRYWQGNKKPHNKVFFKASRRVYEDERDANLKNELLSLTKQTMHDTEDVMKETERIKQEYREDTPHTLPRKRELQTNFRRYWQGDKKPHNKVFFKASRRVYEDERDASLKNKLLSLTKQTMHDTEDVMKETEGIKQEYREDTPHILPRKRELQTNFRRYWQGDKKPHNKVFFKASRRVYEDERDANLKNKLLSLTKQTLHDTEDVMKETERIKQEYREDTPYKAGFILAMLKKSKDVVNELFNVAIKHRDEWQALEQLKIFEIIVHTNIDTTHLLKQLVDVENGLDVVLGPIFNKPTVTDEVKSTDKIHPDEVISTDKIDTDEVKSTDKIDTDEIKSTDKIDTDEVKSTDKIDTDEVKSTDKIDTDEVKPTDKIDTDEVKIIDKNTVDTSSTTNNTISVADETFVRFGFQSVY